MTLDTLEMIYQKSKFQKILEPDQMSLLVIVKSYINFVIENTGYESNEYFF